MQLYIPVKYMFVCVYVAFGLHHSVHWWLSFIKCKIYLLVSDNFPQMAHQKRFIERKYRQELKEMRWEREHQEKEPDETEDIKK